ncbi:MAG: 30S ribosomal protein S28e [Candidatus Aenigmarchaeota archaeon]|nr:30S ribosomal protein S28e [Candidatus Aenigmarchaeota archaeon]
MVAAAEAIQLMGRMGVKGVSKVRFRILEGDDKNKVVMRNVVGPIRVGDVCFIKDTQMDASSRFQRKG